MQYAHVRLLALALLSLPVGHSVDGRVLRPVVLGTPGAARPLLVVGCIHGTEPAGLPVVRALVRRGALPGTEIVVVPALNPDGCYRLGTRGNAHGVDLNRNFPWRWSPLRGVYNSGPHALSEPETRIGVALIARVRPLVSIWFHQHLDVVDDSSGRRDVVARFARAAGMRLAALRREPGSAVTWESHCLPGASSFVVELPAGSLTTTAVARLAGAVGVTVAATPERRPADVCRRP